MKRVTALVGAAAVLAGAVWAVGASVGASAGIEDTPCAAPITITQGGTYTGHWCSTNKTPAVQINTTQAVTIADSAVEGYGNLIQAGTGANVTVRNTIGKGLWTTTNCGDNGRMVYVTGGSSVILENNEVSTAGLAKVIGGTNPLIRIRYNKATNILGEQVNCGGYLQFVQFDGVRSSQAEVAWNQVQNLPDQSRTEDLISLFNSGGTSSSAPFWVHDNFLWGSYPIPSATAGFSGGGIMVGDQGSNAQYVVVENNQVVGTTNYGVSIVCGKNQVVRNNRVVASGRTPSGQWIGAMNVGLSFASEAMWGAGCTTYANNEMSGNVAGWQKQSGRNDWWMPACGSTDTRYYQPGNTCAGNTALKPGQQITYADEQAELAAWLTKSAGLTIGRGGTNTTTTQAPTTTVAPTTTTTQAPTTTTTAPPTTTTTAPSGCVDVEFLKARICPL